MQAGVIWAWVSGTGKESEVRVVACRWQYKMYQRPLLTHKQEGVLMGTRRWGVYLANKPPANRQRGAPCWGLGTAHNCYWPPGKTRGPPRQPFEILWVSTCPFRLHSNCSQAEACWAVWQVCEGFLHTSSMNRLGKHKVKSCAPGSRLGKLCVRSWELALCTAGGRQRYGAGEALLGSVFRVIGINSLLLHARTCDQTTVHAGIYGQAAAVAQQQQQQHAQQQQEL